MSARFLTRFLSALALGTMALATPASAHDRYDSEYEHYRRDRRDEQHHRSEDRRESLGHAIGDLFRYGTTDRYSSPDHYYRDERRDYEHYLRDRDRAWDHYRRDRRDDYRNDDSYRSDFHGYPWRERDHRRR